MLENYILRSNGTHKILQKYKHIKMHKTRKTQIYVVHPVWATFTEKQLVLLLLYYPAN